MNHLGKPRRFTIVAVSCIAASLAALSFAHAADVISAQQSECEIGANKYAAEHPNADPMDNPYFFGIFRGTAPPPKPPFAYHDQSGIKFQVASDGRHLTAVSASGTVLWVRNPFVDGNLCPYRSPHPYIAWIGPPGGDFGRHYLGPFTPTPDAEANLRIVKLIDDMAARSRSVQPTARNARFVGLKFNSSQFGYVNIENGEFYFMGQD